MSTWTGDNLNERVATRVDYPLIKKLLPALRNNGDENPCMVSPYDASNLQFGHHCDCLSNAARYIEVHPDATPVKCFRIWILDQPTNEREVAISCQAHIIPYHNGKYVEVTPPEDGDAGKNFMIVPSSRVYPEYTAERLVELHHRQRLRLRLGGVFHPASWLEFQQRIRGRERAQADAIRLQAYACPFMYDLPEYVPRHILKQLAEACDERNRLLFQLPLLLQLIDAKRWGITESGMRASKVEAA